jgi:hypothetical protein
MDEFIKEILPEAVKVGVGKYTYKEYYICIPCGFIKKNGKMHIRIGAMSGKDRIKRALEIIK